MVPFDRIVSHDLDSAVLNASRCEKLLGHALELVRAATQDDYLEAAVMIEVHVKGRADPVPKLVLDLGQPLRQVTHVVIVDEREGRKGRNAALHLRPDHLTADEVAKELRASNPSFVHDNIEVLEQRSIHRHAEANEVGLHE
jgi:hypothetical protein